MAIEDPALVARSRKAARRQAATDDLMRTLTKADRISGKIDQLARAHRRHERRAERLLRDLPTKPRARAH